MGCIQGSSACVVTRYDLDFPGVESWQGQEIFFSQKASRLALGPSSMLFNWYRSYFLGVSGQGVKLTTILVVPRLRISELYLCYPYAFVVVTGTILFFYICTSLWDSVVNVVIVLWARQVKNRGSVPSKIRRFSWSPKHQNCGPRNLLLNSYQGLFTRYNATRAWNWLFCYL
jgi:hypothetical protein